MKSDKDPWIGQLFVLIDLPVDIVQVYRRSKYYISSMID
jgi:hypothetical protein